MAIPGYGTSVSFGPTGSEVLISNVVSVSINAAPRDVIEVTTLNDTYQKVRPGRSQAPSITVVCHYTALALAAGTATVPTWHGNSLVISYSDGATTDGWHAFINGTPSISIMGDSTVEVTYEFQCEDANPS